MKKLLVVLMVLSMATAANAGIVLSGDAAGIALTGDGETAPGAFYLGITTDSMGAGAVNITAPVFHYTGNANDIYMEEGIGEMIGTLDPVVHIELNDVPPVGSTSPPLTGLLLDGLTFDFSTMGEVTLKLFDGGGTELSSLILPEPMTMILLGLGGLMLRRHK